MTRPSRPACDRVWEADALREGRLDARSAESFERHLRTCAPCKNQVARDEALRDLARGAHQPEPTELERRRLRARVLRDVEHGTPPARRAGRGVAAGLSLAVALGGVCTGLAVRHHRVPPTVRASTEVSTPRVEAVAATTAPAAPPAAEALAGAVSATPGAHWEQARASGIERVRLETGTLTVHVRPQRAGERFLVDLPDGEIEVRGTIFAVTVSAGRTTRVAVSEGTVELRLVGAAERRLGAADVWALATPPAASRSVPAPAAVPPPPVDDPAAHYASAMQVLRDGRNEDAAAAFHTFAATYPAALQAEDASFLEALALARAGRTDAAGLAAERHMAAFPQSFHRREAAILVARAAVARRDCVRAREALAPWRGDPEADAALERCTQP